MSFSTLYPGIEKLVLTSDAPASVVKSPWEQLQLGPAGQPDKLTLYYDAFFSTLAAVNTHLLTYTLGEDLSGTAATAGNWVLVNPALVSPVDELPLARIALSCEGLAQSKPNAVRWFAVTETQSAENVLFDSTTWPKFSADIIGYGVEIDRVYYGVTAPAMSEVGTSNTPSPAPSVRTNEWASIADPVHHYPYGWYLADRKAQRIGGSSLAWLITDVWRYKYRFTP